MNYYLKTNTEQDMWEALEGVNIAVRDYDPEDENNIRPNDAEDDWTPSGDYEWRFTGVALDMIGTIYVESGNTLTDEDGNEYPEMVAIDGFHANLKADFGEETTSNDDDGNPIYTKIIPEGLPIIEPPITPFRVWAGE